MDAASVATKPPAGVGVTSVAVAMARAQETARETPLFRDPYAAAFVAAAREWLDVPGEENQWDSLVAWVDLFYSRGVVRTRFIDDYLAAATAGACGQVVLLGAGLDTRAFRLPWRAGVRVFEVDTAPVFAFKERVLAGEVATPACPRTIIEADLRDDWAARLDATGFDPSVPTAWVAEGVLPYLSVGEARHLLTVVGDRSAPGSRLTFEHTGKGRQAATVAASTARALSLPGAGRIGAHFKGGLGPTGRDWLAGAGWTTRADDRAEVGRGYGRPDVRLPGGEFVTATRD
ncbi:SAM-dependent methyltransferase [Actinomadura rayongensis]|uniref:S-adenosyl-L-methionine-dependent methyltransferase n=1 Tax=Actinomadura rayongensis TaxID=1429076 RepID=A0A6I4WDX7_9ACTN|nr:SAM-dependent methyltransferase [Actinomadura rayongensis]MXQ67891.1 SAM-dependent methyltransferase [Actinomadura rayongensis]